MWERSDVLVVFANSFRQADPFVPVRAASTLVPTPAVPYAGGGNVGTGSLQSTEKGPFRMGGGAKRWTFGSL